MHVSTLCVHIFPGGLGLWAVWGARFLCHGWLTETIFRHTKRNFWSVLLADCAGHIVKYTINIFKGMLLWAWMYSRSFSIPSALVFVSSLATVLLIEFFKKQNNVFRVWNFILKFRLCLVKYRYFRAFDLLQNLPYKVAGPLMLLVEGFRPMRNGHLSRCSWVHLTCICKEQPYDYTRGGNKGRELLKSFRGYLGSF